MLMATVPGNPIKRLIINDVGPFLPKDALERIASYTGNAPDFDDLAALELSSRRTRDFGNLTDGQWRHMAETSHRTLEGSKVALAYDPAIGDNFRASRSTMLICGASGISFVVRPSCSGARHPIYCVGRTLKP